MSVRTVRVAICGCGRIAAAHANELRKIPGVELRAYWSRLREESNAFLKQYGGAYAATDFAEIAADPDIDAAYITTMPCARLPLLEAMAEAGKAVFMEKPLAHAPETLREMRGVLRRKPIPFQSGYKLRFHSLVRKACDLMPRPEVLEAHVMDETWPQGPHNDPDVGGGNVRSQGVYGADILHILAGSFPVSVTAISSNQRRRSSVEDTLSASFEFENGAIGSLTVADAGAVRGTLSKFLVTAAGGNRSVTLLDRFKRLEYCEDGGRSETVLTGEEDGFSRQSESFIAAVRGEKEVECDFLCGAVPSIMVCRALDAAESCRREEISVRGWFKNQDVGRRNGL